MTKFKRINKKNKAINYASNMHNGQNLLVQSVSAKQVMNRQKSKSSNMLFTKNNAQDL